MDQIVDYITGNKRVPLIVRAIGGFGKTSTVHWAVSSLANTRKIQYVVWFSAKPEIMIIRDTEIHRLPGATVNLSLADLLNTTAEAVNQKDWSKLPFAEKRDKIHEFLKHNAVLFVLDNMETVRNATAIIEELIMISEGNPIIITTRHDLKLATSLVVELEALSPAEQIELLNAECSFHDLDLVDSFSEEELNHILLHTSGSPLMIRLLVPQFSKIKDREYILQYLTQAQEEIRETMAAHPWRDLYYFVYRYSWGQLGQEARKTLMRCGNFYKPNMALSVQDIYKITKQEKEALMPSLGQLVDFSLFSKKWSEGQPYYSFHTNTHTFVNGVLLFKDKLP